jgi:hypothetical protein
VSGNAPRSGEEGWVHGVPLFLDQLIDTLQREQKTSARPTSAEMAQSALLHGDELRRAGFTLAQVVHRYGDVCQAVTGLAVELQSAISADEFMTLNRCLDEATAQAVTEFAGGRDPSVSDGTAVEEGILAHELRNHLNNAVLAFEVLKTSTVGVGGSTGALLGRSLLALRGLVDRSLAEVRRDAGLCRREPVAVAQLIQEVEEAAALEAKAREAHLTVTPVEEGLAVDVDRPSMAAALANLLQNAFKFSPPNAQIVLRTDTATTAGRVLIEVEDECGGLPPGRAEDLFRPFAQRSPDRSGLGLGLTIARRTIEANRGQLGVRNVPGRGCVFTIDLPRLPRVPPGTGASQRIRRTGSPAESAIHSPDAAGAAGTSPDRPKARP